MKFIGEFNCIQSLIKRERMSRLGITYEEVAEAALSIEKKGETPTIDKVRAHLGGTGSNTTISKYLQHWRQQLFSSPSKSESVPLIYPLVIYNGSQPYAHSLTLSDLIEPEASRKIFSRLFTEPFCLIDLAIIEDESLRKSAQDRVKGIALLMALKHVFDKNLQTFFDQTLIKVLRQLDQNGDTDEVVDVLYYLLNEGEFLDEKRFWSVFGHQFSREVEGKMATIAEKMEQRGIEKGIEKNNIEIAKQLLSEKIGLSDSDLIALIKRVTGLSEDKIQELRKKH